jgi:hypothetical protein
MPMTLFAKPTPEETFWKWFQKNEARLWEFEKDQQVIMDELSLSLYRYKEDIVYEVSSIENGKREFIISADGLKELFPSVQSLHKAAPKMKRWEIIAFRPRMENYSKFKLEYAGKDFDPALLWFHSRVENNYFDLILYHPEYEEDERNCYISGSYILLDMALGEYDVVTGIRYIDQQKLPDNPKEEGLKPFSELQNTFDNYKKNLANQSIDPTVKTPVD